MTVSIEVVTMIVTVASTLVGLAAGFGWMITRTDARFEKSEQRADARFGHLETGIAGLKADLREVKADLREVKVDVAQVKVELGEVKLDVAQVKVELGEVKLAIARLEGPTPRLLLSR